jgi:hypothetical protein
VVCLVGGGQEINTGEAGLEGWLQAIAKCHSDWIVAHPGRLGGQGVPMTELPERVHTIVDARLHLSVSVRSFRAEAVADFVGAVLEGDAPVAAALARRLDRFPLAIARSIEMARYWLRTQARGTERVGLVASSNAMRLKPFGIHVKAGIDPANWFLKGKGDVRSSYALEDAATEFEVQGLELDWVGLCWDANLRRESDHWSCHAFRGTTWQRIQDDVRRRYLVNAYRVLLTRGRQGCLIVVPYGDPTDATRRPEFYDPTYEFLLACGFTPLADIEAGLVGRALPTIGRPSNGWC